MLEPLTGNRILVPLFPALNFKVGAGDRLAKQDYLIGLKFYDVRLWSHNTSPQTISVVLHKTHCKYFVPYK